MDQKKGRHFFSVIIIYFIVRYWNQPCSWEQNQSLCLLVLGQTRFSLMFGLVCWRFWRFEVWFWWTRDDYKPEMIRPIIRWLTQCCHMRLVIYSQNCLRIDLGILYIRFYLVKSVVRYQIVKFWYHFRDFSESRWPTSMIWVWFIFHKDFNLRNIFFFFYYNYENHKIDDNFFTSLLSTKG